jgi:hypothetical protein
MPGGEIHRIFTKARKRSWRFRAFVDWRGVRGRGMGTQVCPILHLQWAKVPRRITAVPIILVDFAA